jgi:hypothetical protein
MMSTKIKIESERYTKTINNKINYSPKIKVVIHLY